MTDETDIDEMKIEAVRRAYAHTIGLGPDAFPPGDYEKSLATLEDMMAKLGLRP